MVGGEHGDDRLRVARSRPGGRGADGGGAIAPVRLEQDHRLGADFPQLLGDPKPILDIRDDDRRVEYRRVADQADDGLKSRTLPDQGDELLRQALPRFGPHAGARPAAHDHRPYLGHSFPWFARSDCNRQPGLLCNNGGAKAMPDPRRPEAPDESRTEVARTRVHSAHTGVGQGRRASGHSLCWQSQAGRGCSPRRLWRRQSAGCPPDDGRRGVHPNGTGMRARHEALGLF